MELERETSNFLAFSFSFSSPKKVDFIACVVVADRKWEG